MEDLLNGECQGGAMTASTTPKPEPQSPGVKQPASLTREAGPAMTYVPAVQGND